MRNILELTTTQLYAEYSETNFEDVLDSVKCASRFLDVIYEISRRHYDRDDFTTYGFQILQRIVSNLNHSLQQGRIPTSALNYCSTGILRAIMDEFNLLLHKFNSQLVKSNEE